jgi:hypothetical protein
MIPDKNLFIVTSALKPTMGAFSDEQRFSQTIATLKSLREKVPEAIIVFSDVSVRPVTDLEKEAIAPFCDYCIDMSEEPNVKFCAVNGLKSHGENCLMFSTLQALKQNNLLKDVKRIFKFSARSELEDSFDISHYDNLFGKFVFKKRMVSWHNPNTHLFITRMFSFCTSLLDTYLMVIQENLKDLSNNDLPDTEHVHFLNIPEKYLVEFDKLHCWGWLAGNGQIEHY